MIRLARLTKSQHRALHDELGERTDTELAREYRVTEQAIRYHRHGCAATDAQFSWDTHPEGTPLDPAAHARLHRALERGASDEALMEQFGIMWTLVRYHRNQHCDYLLPRPNVPSPTPPITVRPKSKEAIPMKTTAQSVSNADIRQRINAGEPLHAIAEALDVPFTRVRAIKAGMTRRAQRTLTDVIRSAKAPDAQDNFVSAAVPSAIEGVMALEAKRQALVEAYDAQVATMKETLAQQIAVLDQAIDLLAEGSK